MKEVAVIVWIFAVFVSFFYVDSRLPVVHAAATLPANHIVQTGDVDLPGLTGRYLRKQVERRAALSLGDTSAEPILSPGKVLVTLAVPSSQVGGKGFDAGKVVRLCRGSTEVASKVEIVALLCHQASEALCTAVLAPSVEPGKSSLGPLGADVMMIAEDACK